MTQLHLNLNLEDIEAAIFNREIIGRICEFIERNFVDIERFFVDIKR